MVAVMRVFVGQGGGGYGSDGSGGGQLNGDWAGDNNAGDDGGK